MRRRQLFQIVGFQIQENTLGGGIIYGLSCDLRIGSRSTRTGVYQDSQINLIIPQGLKGIINSKAKAISMFVYDRDINYLPCIHATIMSSISCEMFSMYITILQSLSSVGKELMSKAHLSLSHFHKGQDHSNWYTCLQPKFQLLQCKFGRSQSSFIFLEYVATAQIVSHLSLIHI